MAKIKNIDFEKDWFSPNSEGKNFSKVPNKPGVYALLLPKPNFVLSKLEYDILYIGSSKNLYQRRSKHSVLRVLFLIYPTIQFHFKEEENYLEFEKKLIKLYQPKFNTQWR